jgi:hypothetical protein
MKYGDTILKGFATSVAVVFPPSCQSLSGTRRSMWFVVGAAMVMTAVALYPNTHHRRNRHATSASNQVDVDKNISG